MLRSPVLIYAAFIPWFLQTGFYVILIFFNSYSILNRLPIECQIKLFRLIFIHSTYTQIMFSGEWYTLNQQGEFSAFKSKCKYTGISWMFALYMWQGCCNLQMKLAITFVSHVKMVSFSFCLLVMFTRHTVTLSLCRGGCFTKTNINLSWTWSMTSHSCHWFL